jgi:hypothetical protein
MRGFIGNLQATKRYSLSGIIADDLQPPPDPAAAQRYICSKRIPKKSTIAAAQRYICSQRITDKSHPLQRSVIFVSRPKIGLQVTILILKLIYKRRIFVVINFPQFFDLCRLLPLMMVTFLPEYITQN